MIVPKDDRDKSHPKIFIGEDDPTIADLVDRWLRRYGYRIDQARDFRVLDQEIQEAKPDLVLLDINLPFYDGFYWCQRVRDVGSIPILFVTARESDVDQIRALELGGDDYVIKPFNPELLLAKIRALLRRSHADPGSEHAIRFGDLILDLDRNTVTCRGLEASLSKTEQALLRELMKARGAVVSRDHLLAALWDDVHFVDDNTLTVNVSRVRQRLATVGHVDTVVTVRGQGYRLAPRESSP